MHCKGHIREPLIDALGSEREDWPELLGSKAECLRSLGRLYQCTDIVDSMTRELAADWIFSQAKATGIPGITLKVASPVVTDLAERIRQGCNFAQLARVLRPMVKQGRDW